MPRPRKNRVGEYANLLSAEMQLQVARELRQAIQEAQQPYIEALTALQSEVRRLRRDLEALAQRPTASTKQRLGKWVPGGPGRPPKDALQRITAFTTRGKRRPSRKSR